MRHYTGERIPKFDNLDTKNQLTQLLKRKRFMQPLGLFWSKQHTGVTMAPLNLGDKSLQLLDGNHRFVRITRLLDGDIHIVALTVGVTGPVLAKIEL